MLAVVVAEGIAIGLLGVLVLGLLRSHALILRALHELGAGLELEKDGGGHDHASSSRTANPVRVDIESGVVPATRPPSVRGHAVVGTTLAGEEVTIAVQGGGRRTLLAFLSSGCSVCQTFWDELSHGDPAVPGDGRLVVVAQGPDEESVSRLRELAGPRLEVVQSSAAWTDYAVPGSPYFVYVEDGLITGEGSSTSWKQVSDLMGQAVGDAGLGPLDDYADVARVDRELLGAGIGPGHPSLFENPDDEVDVR